MGLGGGVESIRAVSLRPPSRHPRCQRFVPHPAQPLSGLVQRRKRGRGRDASLQFGARGRRWESVRSSEKRGGRPPGPEAVKASGGVVGRGWPPTLHKPTARAQPLARRRRPGRSEPVPERCAAAGGPWPGGGGNGRGPARGAGVAGEAPRAPAEANHAGCSPASFPGARAPPSRVSVGRGLWGRLLREKWRSRSWASVAGDGAGVMALPTLGPASG